MKRLGWLLPLLLGGCDASEPGAPIVRAEMGEATPADGPVRDPTIPAAQRWRSACSPVRFEGSRFTHCIADPEKHRVRTVLAGPGGEPYRGFEAIAAARGEDAPEIAFAMNAGMYDDAGRPIGYYVEGGERVQTLNRAEGSGNFHLKPNGVFYGSDGEWRIRTTDDFFTSVSSRPEFGTQSGPMLVIDGALHPRFSGEGESRKLRNGVGIDARGRAHFAISEEPVSFGRFARLFRDRFETPNALFLDGSVSALWDPARERRDARANLGPFLVVELREGEKP